MGYGSAGAYVRVVADALIASGASDEVKGQVIGDLVGELLSEDWDTVDAVLFTYAHDPGILRGFRRNRHDRRVSLNLERI